MNLQCELANFLDFKMPYAGVPQTVSKTFRDRNRKGVEDYITGIVEGMHIFRARRESAYRAIFEKHARHQRRVSRRGKKIR
jgi:hypothetical protein